MTLSAYDMEVLSSAGFTEHEIEQFATAVDPQGNLQPPVDLMDGTWQTAIADRREWVGRIMEAGDIDFTEALDLIDQFYGADPRANPWDFIKLAYVPKKKADFMEAGAKAREEAIERARKFYRR